MVDTDVFYTGVECVLCPSKSLNATRQEANGDSIIMHSRFGYYLFEKISIESSFPGYIEKKEGALNFVHFLYFWETTPRLKTSQEDEEKCRSSWGRG